MPWPVIDIEDWMDFLEKIEGVRTRKKNSYIFRGQPNFDWLLKPSFMRSFNEPYDRSYMLELEKAVNQDFIKEAYSLINPNLYKETKNMLDWWPIMQHHGAPTRLLDWTGSPYVAAYFAVNQQLDSDGAIWILCVKTLNETMNNIGNDFSSPQTIQGFTQSNALERIHNYSPMFNTDRSIVQQSTFTVCENISSEHSSIIENKFTSNDDYSYYRIRIKKELKSDFRMRLYSMNIRSATLFPGIDGIGRSMAELIELAN